MSLSCLKIMEIKSHCNSTISYLHGMEEQVALFPNFLGVYMFHCMIKHQFNHRSASSIVVHKWKRAYFPPWDYKSQHYGYDILYAPYGSSLETRPSSSSKYYNTYAHAPYVNYAGVNVRSMRVCIVILSRLIIRLHSVPVKSISITAECVLRTRARKLHMAIDMQLLLYQLCCALARLSDVISLH